MTSFSVGCMTQEGAEPASGSFQELKKKRKYRAMRELAFVNKKKTRR
jgi:hypothetical protein